MIIYVKLLSGTTCALRVRSTDTVQDLKWIIEAKQGIPYESQRLIFAGKQLEDNRTLLEYNILEDDTVMVVLRLLGK